MDTNTSHMLRWRGRQQGPFTLAQIERKLAENEIGMLHEIQVQGQWLTLRDRFEAIDAERRLEVERVAAAERVAAQAGSARLRAGTKQQQVDGTREVEAAREPAGKRLEVGDCIKRAWQLTLKNPVETIIGWALFGFLYLVVWLLFGGIVVWASGSLGAGFAARNTVTVILSLICLIVALVASALVLGALWGGICCTFIGVARGQAPSLGSLFSGFQRRPLQLAGGYSVPKLVASVVFIVPLVIYIEIVVLLAFVGGKMGAFSGKPSLTTLFFGGLFSGAGFIIACLVAIALFAYFFTTMALFVVPLVVDKQIGFIRAMRVSSRQISPQFWGVFGLLLLAQIIASSGALLFGVGVIFTVPLAVMSLAVAYTSLFTEEVDYLQDGNSGLPPVPSRSAAALPWVLGVGFAIVLLLGAAIGIMKLAHTSGEPRPHGTYAYNLGKVSGIEAGNLYIEFSADSKCRARILNIFDSNPADYTWRKKGTTVEIMDRSKKVVETFTYDSENDCLTSTLSRKGAVYQAEHPKPTP